MRVVYTNPSQSIRVVRQEAEGYFVRYYIERRTYDALGASIWAPVRTLEAGSMDTMDNLLLGLLSENSRK